MVWVQTTSSRPLIFIPGILGSKLINEEGKLIWGGSDSYINFHKLRLPRNDTDIKLKPGGVIDTITVWPFKLKQYDRLLQKLRERELGYKEGMNLFYFDYDWRRSNFKNAKLLDEYIQNTPEIKNNEFDIIAHSMGGLISLILIQEYDSGKNVKNLITLGTPFYGSLEAFDTFLNGFNGVSSIMASLGSSAENVRSVMFSFESGYELLPTYPYCCKVESQQKNIFDLGFWQNQWLPDTFATESDKRFITESLKRARKLGEIVQRDLPSSLKLTMYAGETFATKKTVSFDASGNIKRYNYRKGDGTVWLASAANNDISSSRVTFAKHAKIFEDDNVLSGLARKLKGDTEGFAAIESDFKITSKTNKQVLVDLISFTITPPIIKSDNTVTITLELTGSTIERSDEEFDFLVCIKTVGKETEEACVNLPELNKNERKLRRFQVGFKPSSSGVHIATIKGYEKLEDYFFVISKE